ncbi:ribosome biogenesis protein ytm1 [Xylona heveae TC161]|uniref:Ribosome biogenesis protein YTM1 n=1 Tax=Xylona heveae (strain CBS 132557 / TC161) TaxID=1328760 RepID=A0A165IDL8_XYLHT|nr:ribosome biogenesis protein ytm1 [Xylona heveae TC161]KZF24744.1 ribosome biogenesis protein ytm1 [Xylona heveae TC161]
MSTIETETHQDSTTQVRVRLTTRDADLALPPESSGPILVSTGLRRYALSTLVNTLLESEKPVPFEFLINGTFLRTSLDEYLTANGISAETTLTLEYVRARVPPSHIASFEHDDWVSAVDVLSSKSAAASWATDAPVAPGQERILSASYDGLLRVWNTSSQLLATSPSPSEGGHSNSIKAAKFLSPSQIVSAGLDRTVRVWNYTADNTLKPALELYGHKSSVDALAVHAPSKRILSASADHTVGIWSTTKSGAPAAPSSLISSTTSSSSSSKRRKVAPGPAVSAPQRGPLGLLHAHTAPVSDVIFSPADSTVAYSTSLDHTLRTWDLTNPTAAPVSTRTTAHSLLSLTALPSLHLLAAGTSARHITLIDPRDSAASISALTLRGHANAIVSLAADPSSPYGLLSGSHDGTARVWDVRSTTKNLLTHGVGAGESVGESVYVIPRESRKETAANANATVVGGEGVKVFGVAWDPAVGILSAGEDRRVQINRGEGVIQTA